MENQTKTAQKFYCLSRDFSAMDSFAFYELESPDQHEAWGEIEENIATSMSQDWLLTKEEILTIKRLLADFE